jgi:predicted RND superfamily exporter protein
MWAAISRFVLRNRIAIIIVLGCITVMMGYYAHTAEISYESPKLLPDHDTTAIEYKEFKKRFGQDGSIMAIGIDDKDLYQLERFNDWYDLGNAVKDVPGVKAVVSIARLNNLYKNDSLSKFEFVPIVNHRPKTQTEVDAYKNSIVNLPFYKDVVYNDSAHATLMLITFDNKRLNTKSRFDIVDAIKVKVDKFVSKTHVGVHYSGMPYIRTAVARKIQDEMTLFMVLALIVTGIILFIFFRSVLPVVFSLAVVFVGVIWSVGLLVLFGYQISVLTGLIPPLLIVIGVPNCIMLLNKYHIEHRKHGNKILSLSRAIEKIGPSLFLANVTTSIGFAVFCSTDSKLLFEFGLVSSISAMCTYAISMMLVPIVFSFLPPPSVKHTKHLQAKVITKLLEKVDYIVHHHRKRIYFTVIVIVVISIFGITKILPLGYVVDDLPKKDPVLLDLKYFEKNYHGVLPFEISIDTKKPNGVFADGGRTLYKINKLQKLFSHYPEFSRPISIVEGVKFLNQAYNDGEKKSYRLPGAIELQKLSDYATNESKGKQGQFSPFIDSTKQYTRIDIAMADIGSIRMARLIDTLKPKIDSIFNFDYETNKWLSADKNYNVVITGNSLMFLKGNAFLVENLLESVLLAIILIAIVMYTLFMSPRMILISVIPSLVPLIITAGLMGFFNIHLKPSTILIFSIAFGISSDGTMYFLTKYRQEMKILHSKSISKVVSLAIKETGVSMIYTAIILFCGFGIFTASSFGGTAALGILISVTLLIAYCSNLVLLPCFLLSLEKRLTNKAFLQEPLIDVFDEDGDIDLDELEIKK